MRDEIYSIISSSEDQTRVKNIEMGKFMLLRLKA